MINFEWKPISQIPTEHWEKNYAISPAYLVRCGQIKGMAIIGYAHYSFVTNKWMLCHSATEPGVWDVEEWTDVKL